MSNENNQIKWKSGRNNTKSVVLTDFELFQPNETDRSITDRIVGTAGWAPPEQWCPSNHADSHSQSIKRYVLHELYIFTIFPFFRKVEFYLSDSPEIGPEDAFAFGRVLTFIFSDWLLAWKLIFQPMIQIKR